MIFVFLGVNSPQTGPHFISRDWRGIRPPVDAAIVGRVYISPKPTLAPAAKKRKSQRKRPSKRRGQRIRQSRHLLDDLWFYDGLFDFGDYSDSSEESSVQQYQSTPVQNVYFFQRGKSDLSRTEKMGIILPKTLFVIPSLTPFGLYVSFLFTMADKYYRVALQTKRVDAGYPRSIGKYWLGCEHEDVPDASRAEKK